jgi:flagellar protein FliJ
MKSLNTLLRVRQRELDEKRRALKLLEDESDGLHQSRAALAAEKTREAESVATSENGGFGYGSYLAAWRQRDAGLQRDIAALAERVEAARDEIADAFAEIKRYELIENAQNERQRKAAVRREQIEMDELGLGIYRRGAAETQ